MATWCLAVTRAAPSVAYLRLPLTGHLEALSIANHPSISIIGYQAAGSKAYRGNCSIVSEFIGSVGKRVVVQADLSFRFVRGLQIAILRLPSSDRLRMILSRPYHVREVACDGDAHGVACRNSVQAGNLLAVLSWVYSGGNR